MIECEAATVCVAMRAGPNRSTPPSCVLRRRGAGSSCTQGSYAAHRSTAGKRMANLPQPGQSPAARQIPHNRANLSHPAGEHMISVYQKLGIALFMLSAGHAALARRCCCWLQSWGGLRSFSVLRAASRLRRKRARRSWAHALARTTRCRCHSGARQSGRCGGELCGIST